MRTGLRKGKNFCLTATGRARRYTALWSWSSPVACGEAHNGAGCPPAAMVYHSGADCHNAAFGGVHGGAGGSDLKEAAAWGESLQKILPSSLLFFCRGNLLWGGLFCSGVGDCGMQGGSCIKATSSLSAVFQEVLPTSFLNWKFILTLHMTHIPPNCEFHEGVTTKSVWKSV